jgi:hypothetical protein
MKFFKIYEEKVLFLCAGLYHYRRYETNKKILSRCSVAGQSLPALRKKRINSPCVSTSEKRKAYAIGLFEGECMNN